MTALKLNKDEEQRLATIADDILDIGALNVYDHLETTGKVQALRWTAFENEEQKKAQIEREKGSKTAAALADLKFADVFIGVTRRVANDAELAACVPAGKFDKKDAELLEKFQLNSLVALVKQAIKKNLEIYLPAEMTTV